MTAAKAKAAKEEAERMTKAAEEEAAKAKAAEEEAARTLKVAREKAAQAKAHPSKCSPKPGKEPWKAYCKQSTEAKCTGAGTAARHYCNWVAGATQTTPTPAKAKVIQVARRCCSKWKWQRHKSCQLKRGWCAKGSQNCGSCGGIWI